ncbi:MAG: hypothetical protein IJW75_03300 [Alphaproteobacteria bacterium]|nr:hypothetical protein [Alphaproteobacteria bacterium]
MHLYIKEEAITCLNEGIYPQEVIDRFLSEPKHKNKRKWLSQICTKLILRRYVECKDTKFYGNVDLVEKARREFFNSYGISIKNMEHFERLNYLFLLKSYNTTNNEALKHYYHMILCLNGGDGVGNCILFERRKLGEFIHKEQVKLINRFAKEKSLCKEDLYNFILVVILFSQSDISHDAVTKKNFLKLCRTL